jgi:ubiquinone/menaquinone biosynthesis C-methylase UbiE
MSSTENEIQRQYYSDTAVKYESMHVHQDDEHFFALGLMIGLLDYLKVESILDIGSGTGRAISHIKKHRPDIKIVGIEPVQALRDVANQNGISQSEIIDGDATNLNFFDGEFDLVCEFGVLHHIKNPEAAVSEMLRVSKKAIFISDVNNFGTGNFLGRLLKQLINFTGLWKALDFVKTRGKGYIITEGDGLSYSYSVFNNYSQISKKCTQIHLMNTKDGQVNPYTTASHIALLGIKK